MAELRYLEDVVTLKLDPNRCNGCGMCLEVCPHAVFAMNGKKAEIIDRNACMECGACALNCPTEALTVKAGVGCAAAVLTQYLSKKNSDKKFSCGCELDPPKKPTCGDDQDTGSCCSGTQKTSCC
jgi:NAD-dependent dihydropyrimidine dehydrogenase PreA subunit